MINERTSWWRRRRYGVEIPVDTERLSHSQSRHVADTADTVVARLTVMAALARLPARQRAVIVLRYFDDFTEAAAADAPGCSIGTVKSQTHAALTRLRALAPHMLSDVLTPEVTRD
jgi:RNA polymerase sigma factor (sigma-70 family)